MKRILLLIALALPLGLHADPSASSGQVPPPAPVVAVTPETTPEVLHSPKVDPGSAFRAALWPGIVLHGSGYRAAQDTDTFLNLAGGEIFSVVLMGFGLAEALGPDVKDETKTTSQAIAAAGGVIFLGTWAWDLIGAPAAARRFNAEHNLSLLPRGDGAQLACAIHF